MDFNPYLFFSGTCEEAFTFYASVFDGKISQISHFADMPPDPNFPIADEVKNNVMHARMESKSLTLFGSDGRPGHEYKGGNVSLSLSFEDVAEGEAIFKALSSGGYVETPLMDMFWGAKFGQFTDRFGIDWMVNIALAPAHTSA